MFQAEIHLNQEKECILSELARETGGPLDIELEELHDHKVTFVINADGDFEEVYRRLEGAESVHHVESLGGDSILATKPSCGAYSAVYKNHGILRRENHISANRRVYNVLVFQREDLKNVITDFREIGTVTLGKLTDFSETRSDLTERQRETVEHAFERGYFEWPRAVSSEELAEDLGISRATFLEHLRKAEYKLLSRMLDDENYGRPGRR